MDRLPNAGALLREWIARSGLSQSEIASNLGVTRAAVSKWCSGIAAPATDRAKTLDRLSQGAVPSTAWPRRLPPPPVTKGARVIQSKAARHGGIPALAAASGLPPRALFRWAYSQHTPRGSSIADLNHALGVNLTARDFEVQA